MIYFTNKENQYFNQKIEINKQCIQTLSQKCLSLIQQLIQKLGQQPPKAAPPQPFDIADSDHGFLIGRPDSPEDMFFNDND